MLSNLLLNRTINAGLLVLIVFTVLAHGAVESWSIGIFHLLTLLLFTLWGFKCIFDRKVKIKIPLSALPLFLFFALGIIQSITYERADGIIASLSFEPDMTRSVVTSLGFLILVHLIAANQLVSNRHFKIFANFLTIFGFLLAVFALLQYFTWNGRLYWLLETSMGAAISGPFVNRNHFAGLMELIIPMPIALILGEVQQKTRVIYGFAAVVMIISTIASVSRGGIISLILGIFFLTVVWFSYLKRSVDDSRSNKKVLGVRQMALGFGLVAVVVAGTLWVAGDPVTERVTNNSIVDSTEDAQTFYQSRGWIWGNSWIIFRENPVYGTGLGTHQTVFPVFSKGDGRTAGGERITFSRAHNDYLQILTDSGIIGAIIMAGFLGILIYYLRRIFYINDPMRAVIAIAGVSSIFMLLIHSIVDFNLQIISNALLFLVIVALLGNSIETQKHQSAL